ncbi:hypothetical protein [Persicobacter sp. CCB-QB2]|uniref:hypothetical protein n=1 Tax=Persicobacter sp. CCB-QB2 TaxID=1561025 RepID=UPI000AC80564|nr:hypothetical protein [Persicobacter sp. CCB-QB2]
MLRFFRINDPFRLLIITVILIAVRLPFLVENSLTQYELKWMLVGEQLAMGKSMYLDVFDHSGPLSAGMYWFLSMISGRSPILPRILALVLVLLQASIFNNICNRFKVYEESNFVPSLLYTLGMSLFFEMQILSPELLGLSCLMMALYYCIEHITSRERNDEIVIRMGLMLGLATLFHPIFFFFFLGIFIMMIFFSNTIVRRYAVILYGFSLPIFLAGLYYFWKDAGTNFIHFFITENIKSITPMFNSLVVWSQYLPLIGALMLFSVFGQIKALSTWHMNNRQTLITITMISQLVVGTLITILLRPKNPHDFIILIPWLAFFIPFYFFRFRRKWLSEVFFGMLILGMIVPGILLDTGYWAPNQRLEKQAYLLKETNLPAIKDKNILVLGEDLSPYWEARADLAYIGWQSLAADLKNDKKIAQYRILASFGKQLPEVIIDQKEVMPELENRVPKLKAQYVRNGNTYQLKN